MSMVPTYEKNNYVGLNEGKTIHVENTVLACTVIRNSIGFRVLFSQCQPVRIKIDHLAPRRRTVGPVCVELWSKTANDCYGNFQLNLQCAQTTISL